MYDVDTTHDDWLRLLEMVDGRVMDDFMEELVGGDATREVDTDGLEMTAVELKYAVHAFASAHDEVAQTGQFHEAVMFHRLLERFLALDDEVGEQFEEYRGRASPQEQLQEMMGGAIMTDLGDLDPDDFDGRGPPF